MLHGEQVMNYKIWSTLWKHGHERNNNFFDIENYEWVDL